MDSAGDAATDRSILEAATAFCTEGWRSVDVLVVGVGLEGAVGGLVAAAEGLDEAARGRDEVGGGRDPARVAILDRVVAAAEGLWLRWERLCMLLCAYYYRKRTI